MTMPFMRAYTTVSPRVQPCGGCVPRWQSGAAGCCATARKLHLRSLPPLTLPLRSPTTPRAQLVVKTCHKRGCFAMGGMSAMIPIKGDDAANQVSA